MYLALLFVLAAEIPIGSPPVIEQSGNVNGLIFDGSQFVVSYRAGPVFGHIPLGQDGTPLRATSFDAAEGETSAFASNGRGSVAVTVHGGVAYATRFDDRGEQVAQFIAAPSATAVALCWDGAHYVLAYQNGVRPRLSVSFIGENGATDGGDVASDFTSFAIAGTDGLAVIFWSSNGRTFARSAGGAAIDLGEGEVFDASAGSDGFLALTLVNGEVIGRHLDLTGHSDASYPIPGARPGRVARERYTYALAWADGNSVRAVRMQAATGSVGNPFTIATLDAPVNGVAVAATVANTLICYSAKEMFAKPLNDTAPGKPLLASHVAAQTAIRVAGDVVAWQQEDDGIHVGDAVVASGPDIQLQDVVVTPVGTLVVWNDASGLHATQRGTLSSCSGTARALSDSTIFYTGCDGTYALPASGSPERVSTSTEAFEIARAGDRFLLAYNSGAAIVLDRTFHSLARLTIAADALGTFTLGSDPIDGDSVAVWKNAKGEIVAQRVGANGELIGARIVVDDSAAPKDAPHVRWDGVTWVVTWPERVDSTHTAFASVHLSDLRKSYIAGAPGIVLDWSEGATAIFYTRLDAPPGLNPAPRLFVQSIAPPRRRAAAP